MGEAHREVSLIGSEREAFVGPIIEQTVENGESLHGDTLQTTEMAEVPAISELTEFTAAAPEVPAEIPETVEQIDEIPWPAYEAGDAFDGAKETSCRLRTNLVKERKMQK